MTHQIAAAPSRRIRGSRRIAEVFNRPASTIGLVVILTGFGVGLTLQPARWSGTPAYGILMSIFPPIVWGLIYLVLAAAMLLTAIFQHHRIVSLTAHALALVLLMGWEIAFTLRTITDSNTTVANVIAWATYVALVVRSATLIDSSATSAELDALDNR